VKIKAAAKLLCVCLTPLMPLFAHHSFSAEFDGTNEKALRRYRLKAKR